LKSQAHGAFFDTATVFKKNTLERIEKTREEKHQMIKFLFTQFAKQYPPSRKLFFYHNTTTKNVVNAFAKPVANTNKWLFMKG